MSSRNENATRPTGADVAAYLDAIQHPTRRADALTLLKMMEEITGEPAVMWGDSLIGFGSYHYRYASGREGDWAKVAFAARKANLVLYGLQDPPDADALLERLGKHRRGVGCVYLNKLADVDEGVLRSAIELAWSHRSDG